MGAPPPCVPAFTTLPPRLLESAKQGSDLDAAWHRHLRDTSVLDDLNDAFETVHEIREVLLEQVRAAAIALLASLLVTCLVVVSCLVG